MHIGAIADDFTGATDLATTLQSRGLRAAVVIGDREVDERWLSELDAVVIALKSRTSPVATAVSASRHALDRLLDWGADRVYVKYCSTFDSTDAGNIGPVLDVARERLETDRTVVVPSFPANGRTVEGGNLRVHGELLEDSPMRHHPLTPMTRSRVRDILAPQTAQLVSEVPLSVVREGVSALRRAIDDARPGYLVVDAVTEEDLDSIANATSHLPLLSGAAALAAGIDAPGSHGPSRMPTLRLGRLVVAGSASAATRSQVAAAIAAGLPTRQIDLSAAVEDPDTEATTLAAWARTYASTDIPVVYSAAQLSDVTTAPDGVAVAVERVISRLVCEMVQSGDVDRIVVAGGETSGAVVLALDLSMLRIGPQLAPGVCWTAATTADGPEICLVLKSGNFGSRDLFIEAWEALP